MSRPLGYERPADWTEAVWQAQLRELAKTLGWLVYHPHRSERSASGFPDLTLVRDRVVFVELKRQDKAAKLRPDQELWRDRLLAAGAEWYCWRPLDVDECMRVLGKRRRPRAPRATPSVFVQPGTTLNASPHPLPADPEVARARLLELALRKR